MTEIVQEWVDKADTDFASAELLFNPPTGKPNFDLVCFLSQQCVEKYLKGFLQSNNIPFTKTHDLPLLLSLALPLQPLWEAWRSAFGRLTEYAVECRYPGEWADPRKAKLGLDIAEGFRKEARSALGIIAD